MYDAFGNEVNPDARNTNPFRYAGEYFDFETGNYYLRARFFNPRSGRFTQPDPHWNLGNMIFGDRRRRRNGRNMPSSLAIMQSSNLFMYTMHNPIRWVDPSGRTANSAARSLISGPMAAVAFMQVDGKQVATSNVNKSTPSSSVLNNKKARPSTPQDKKPAIFSQDDIWDQITIDRINDLHPAIRNPATALILDAQNRGIYLRISSGYRTFAEQDALFELGRSILGTPIVTNVRGGGSFHNYGLAIDVVEFTDPLDTANSMTWDSDWDLIGQIGKSYGFEWGGDWTGSFVDRPHFQMTFGHSADALNIRLNQGMTTDGFVTLH